MTYAQVRSKCSCGQVLKIKGNPVAELPDLMDQLGIEVEMLDVDAPKRKGGRGKGGRGGVVVFVKQAPGAAGGNDGGNAAA